MFLYMMSQIEAPWSRLEWAPPTWW